MGRTSRQKIKVSVAWPTEQQQETSVYRRGNLQPSPCSKARFAHGEALAKRIANDHRSYTLAQFLKHSGARDDRQRWAEAKARQTCLCGHAFASMQSDTHCFLGCDHRAIFA